MATILPITVGRELREMVPPGDLRRLHQLCAEGLLKKREIELIETYYSEGGSDVILLQTSLATPIRAIIIGSIENRRVNIRWFWVHPEMPETRGLIETLDKTKIGTGKRGY